MSLHKKTKKILLIVLGIYTGLFLVLPYTVLAYDIPKDKNYPVYGIVEEYWAQSGFQKTCGNLYLILQSITDGSFSLPPNTILHYENLYNYQCLGKTISEHSVYERPYDRSARTSNQQSCQEFQEGLITKLFDEELEEDDLSDSDKIIYINQCVLPPLGWVDRYEMQEDRGIPLMAPLPVEGGDYVENTNKTYIFSYMIKLYRFVIGIAGIVAVGEFVLGGYMIALAAGDSSRVESAKKRMVQTLEGLALLFVTAIILNTINPQAYNFDTNVSLTESYVGQFTYSSGMYNWGDPSLAVAPPGQEVQQYCSMLDSYLGITVTPLTDNIKRLDLIKEKHQNGEPYKSVLYNPQVTSQVIASIITSGPLKDIGQEAFEKIEESAKAYNVNPLLGLFMWKMESKWGELGAANTSHNIGNIRPTQDWQRQNYAVYKGPAGEFMDFKTQFGGAPNSWLTGIPYWFQFIREKYIDQGYDTVEEIIPRYAPCTEKAAGGNNTKEYIELVLQNIDNS